MSEYVKHYDPRRIYTVKLTGDEIAALIYAYDIEEFPLSNALGRGSYTILENAQGLLCDALGAACPEDLFGERKRGCSCGGPETCALPDNCQRP